MNYESLFDAVSLKSVPTGQIFIGKNFLIPLYKWRKLKVNLDGLENIPDRPVIFAMNHTDRYNYWPFQLNLYLNRDKVKYCFTATWVKLKYYESKLLTKFFNWTGELPMPSKGYLIAKDLKERFGQDKKLLSKYYRSVKDFLDGKIDSNQIIQDKQLYEFLNKLDNYKLHLENRFKNLMTRAFELNRDAVFNKKLNLLVFPEGTRSKRLKRCKTGVVQFSVSLGVPVVPVGCNGSDKTYTKDYPWIEKNRTITYRIGKPIFFYNMREFEFIDKDFIPFTEKAEKNKEIFEKAADLLREKIAQLLDDEYKPIESDTEESSVEKFIL